MGFDLLIKGGEVVDPGGGREGRLDVAINRDRIAAVDSAIPADAAHRIVDADGQYVTPGLVDLHTHVFHKVTYWGINPIRSARPPGRRPGTTRVPRVR
jgi:dihydroorotase